ATTRAAAGGACARSPVPRRPGRGARRTPFGGRAGPLRRPLHHARRQPALLPAGAPARTPPPLQGPSERSPAGPAGRLAPEPRAQPVVQLPAREPPVDRAPLLRL